MVDHSNSSVWQLHEKDVRELPRAGGIRMAKDAKAKLPVFLPSHGFPVAVPLKLLLAHVCSNRGHIDDIPQRPGRAGLVWVLQKDVRKVATTPVGNGEM